ncbi:TetR/AcrR family transcriptional regulator [Pseudomonas sp. UL073]|uniref:TetR/AcrR family transcriptional regulator n=1 Tax=Zestomonas insulae TaxID=2809017 RepID=A0ABS2IAZ6_9GAMM|nr:TetR/AcrR family transcriptional regulator [Pseudomonas insulae]MBM7060137.1 TetR/AcrR family transcriptional regulator [Pseudomonas insulae]
MEVAGELGAVRAVFEDLGGHDVLLRQGEGAEGPLVGHLQRTNIQLAAIPVFVRKGLAETTVNDLLEAAKVSRRTFYKYFANKIEVLEGIYRTSVLLLLSRFRELEHGAGNAQAWLQRMVDCFFEYHLAVGPIIRLMQEEALRADSPLAPHRQRAHQEMVRLLRERLESQDEQQDPLLSHTLIWAMEAASLDLLVRQAPRSEIEHAKQVLGALVSSALCLRST